MPYIGNSPKNNVRDRYYYTATSGQTLFNGPDIHGRTLAYQDGRYVDVYLNGVILQDTTDYTATTKTSVTLVSGATTGDLVEIVAYGIFSVSDTVSAASGGEFAGNVTINARLDVDNVRIDGNIISSTDTNGDITLDPNGTGDTIIASGNFGVGTTSPGGLAEFYKAGTSEVLIGSDNGGTAQLSLYESDDGTKEGLLKYDGSSNRIHLATSGNANAFIMIRDTGQILMSRTGTSGVEAGHRFDNNGFTQHVRSGGQVMELSRQSNDGDIQTFKDGGTVIGSIGGNGNNRLYIVSGDTGLDFERNTDAIRPCSGSGGGRDNVIDLGRPDVRFDDIYATNGSIQTSDQNEKNTIANSDLGLDFINRLSPKSYIYNGKTRTHYGLIAQDVETVLSDISKPASEFAGFIKSDTSDEQDGSEYKYGLRYTEFVGPLIQAVKDLKAELDAAKARIAALEAE